MANLRYYNQSGPFWDFIAGLEGRDWTGQQHPFTNAYARPRNNQQEKSRDTDATMDGEDPAEEDIETIQAAEGENGGEEADFSGEEFMPWMHGWGHFGGRRGGGRHGRGGPEGLSGGRPEGFGRRGGGEGGRGRHGRHDAGGPPRGFGGFGHHRGPPPPGFEESLPMREASGPAQEGERSENEGRSDGERKGKGRHGGPHGSRHGGPHARGHHGLGGFGTRGRHGGRGGGFGGGRGGSVFGERKHGGRHGRGMNGFPFHLGKFAEFLPAEIVEAMSGAVPGVRDAATPETDFEPPVDIFDTESAFVIHISLPGAKKEDVAASWDAEKSEVIITGVIHRPGDEEFLKTLALDERDVGAFERKVRLGSRANPAQVDADGISAKLEDGILRVTVPKEDKEFDIIHKVDIE